MVRTLIIVVAVLALSSAEARADIFGDPPAAAPPQFSRIVGKARIVTSVTPTEVEVEKPITLTVRITGDISPKYRPQRDNLRIFPDDLEKHFYIEAVPNQDRQFLIKGVWEFVYRLRPKTTGVKAIPGLRLVYYSPDRKKFQTSFADEIPITVTAPPEAPPPIEELKIAPVPERFYRLYPADAVLRDETPLRVSPVLAGVLFALPPLGCVAWLVTRKGRHASVQKHAEMRRSRAARLALSYLETQEPNADRSATALTDYLRQRFDLRAADPSPAELDSFLRRVGATKLTRQAWSEFFESLDHNRYAPPGARFSLALTEDDAKPAAEAVRLIHTLEADPCVAR